MATKLKIRRTSGSSIVGLDQGELAYVYDNAGSSSGQGQAGQRIYIGDIGGSGNTPLIIGGKYFTDLMDHAHGTLTASSAIIVDSNSKVDKLYVDAIRLGNTDANTIDTDSGKLILDSFAGQVDINDRLVVSGITTVSNTTDASSTTTGALIVSGGAGIAKNVFIGGNLDVVGYIGFSSQISISGITTISNTTDSTSTTTGALVVSGGVGIAKNLVVGAAASFTGLTTVSNTTDSSSPLTGALEIAGGVGIVKNLNVGAGISAVGIVTTLNTTDASSTTTGALQTRGGLAVAKTLIVGAGASVAGITTVTDTTDSSSTTTGSLQTRGGLAVAKNLVVGAAASFTGLTTVSNTTDSSGTTNGAFVVSGGVGVGKNLNVGGGFNLTGAAGFSSSVTITQNLTVNGNTNLGNSQTDLVTVTGHINQTGITTITGALYVDAVGINSNTIFTQSGSGNTLYIDPYPDGLSNEGTVVIKGDLQVDGTTTTVNSITVTSNNPIYVVGDNATTRTVTVAVGAGVTGLTLDSVAGINTNDVVSGTNIASNTVISAYNAGTKVITLSNATTGSIDAQAQITISQGVDTNDDRGIGFKYVSSGVGTAAVVKTGFFGYVDSTSRWTYVPDATLTGNVVSGTKGYLDIYGVFLQATNTNGAAYFNGNGELKSTVAPGSGISTSNYVLTTDASGVPTWTDTIDGGTF